MKRALALVGMLVTASCGPITQVCSGVARPALAVLLKDGRTNASITSNARIVFSVNGARPDTSLTGLTPASDPVPSYVGDAAGTYTLVVSKAGYAERTVSNIVVTATGGDCPQVNMQSVEVVLQPIP